jgi:hypothetical protein
MCVVAFVVVVEYPLPWQRLHEYSLCSWCSPEDGGTPWHWLQLCRAAEPVRPQYSSPWQEMLLHVRRAGSQPESVTSWRAFRWSVGFALVAV